MTAEQTEQLAKTWTELHEKIMLEIKQSAEKDETSPLEEAYFESLCMGWVMGQGFSGEEGYDFYREMVKRGVF